MMNYLFDNIRKIQDRLRVAERIFLFLDYDGTLADIVLHPEDANLPREVRTTLSALKKTPRISMAIVSGRSLSDIRNRVGLSGIHYVGNHGLEIFTPKSGMRQLLPKETIGALRTICDRLNCHFKGIEGILVEDKRCTLAVHYRTVDPRWVPSILMILEQEIKKSITPLCLRFGKMVFEVRPRRPVNKGTTILDLLGKADQNGVLPIYIGDDQTDEDAFRVLKRRGITIVVGIPKPTISSAQYYVKDPSEVHGFLKKIEENLAGD
jgi:trehalose-phosphatase